MLVRVDDAPTAFERIHERPSVAVDHDGHRARHFLPDERIDDTGGGPSEQSRPSLAIGGPGVKRVCYVAWADGRNGDRDIYVASRACGG